MKQQEILEKKFLSEVKNADIFSAVNGFEVLRVGFGYKSARIVLGLEGHSDYTLDIVYDGYGKKDELSTNVATFGPFELLDASATAQYYMAVGNLLNHKALLADLKKIMKEYVAKMKEVEKEEED